MKKSIKTSKLTIQKDRKFNMLTSFIAKFSNFDMFISFIGAFFMPNFSNFDMFISFIGAFFMPKFLYMLLAIECPLYPTEVYT